MPGWFRRVISVALAVCAVSALAGAAISHLHRAPRESPQSSVGGQPGGAALPNFAFPNQRAEVVSKQSLAGHVWVADFIFTTCTSACPLITSRFVTLQRRLLDRRLRFVSFSVDPERDTVNALAKYAASWAVNEQRWQLLRTDRAGLGVLSAGLHLALEKDDDQIIHTSRLFLIDALGNRVADYDSTDDSALDRLVVRARELLGAPTKDAALSGMSAELFGSLGCAGCHADAQLAPPLGGLFGSHVMLERGATALVDDEYVRESIANPSSKLVSGYPNSMPSYGPLLSAEQLQSLVSYLHSLPAAELLAVSAAQTDPVCGMPVRVGPQTPQVDHQGKTYHFCSQACALRFSAAPRKYLAGTHSSKP